MTDLAGRRDDELQQTAGGRLRLCPWVEARLLPHDRQQQRRIGVVRLRIVRDEVVEVARIEQLADGERQEVGDVVARHTVHQHLDRVDRLFRSVATVERERLREG